VEGLGRRSLEHKRMLAVVVGHEMPRLQSPRRQDHGSLDEVPEWFLEIGSERRIAGPGGVKKTDRRGKASRPGRR
jgi:hypothetical protein